ncbi:MAG: hypothetical protein JXR91_05805 [Deltaproteobacteria bacterium]|nr:hypothetical protein [Deltaproteobacteria bacterium]
MSTLESRTEIRKQKMKSHKSSTYEESEKWDLEYWLSCTPDQRLAAHVAILNDVEIVKNSALKDSNND